MFAKSAFKVTCVLAWKISQILFIGGAYCYGAYPPLPAICAVACVSNENTAHEMRESVDGRKERPFSCCSCENFIHTIEQYDKTPCYNCRENCAQFARCLVFSSHVRSEDCNGSRYRSRASLLSQITIRNPEQHFCIRDHTQGSNQSIRK